MFLEIIAELKRLFEALMGKWSLPVWMDTVKVFTDQTIQEAAEQDGLIYQHGTCFVEYTPGNDISAHIQLVFEEPTGTFTQIEAKRTFPEKRFLSETRKDLAQRSPLSFSVEKPKE